MPGETHGINFWLAVYAASITFVVIWMLARLLPLFQRRRHLTWDIHSEYIDIAEFSNRNIPLKVTYKGSEPRWLWATYLSLRNTGSEDLSSDDSPDKQGFVVGAPDCRYIGFNKLISDKAKVVMNPLFRGNDVYCKVEFDRLGPGDEILVSLLFVADEQARVNFEGALFGANSRVMSGYMQRMTSWRALWWLLIGVVISGVVGAIALLTQAEANRQSVLYQFLTLLALYSIALFTAAVLLRPIYNWQQMLERFGDKPDGWRAAKQLRFLLGLDREP